MTTTAAPTAAHPAVSASSTLTGTGALLRLALRRDRVILPLWSITIGLLPIVYGKAIMGLYTTQSQLDAFAASTATLKSEIALVGPIFGSSVGALTTWRAGYLFTFLAVAVILTVVRHTRTEEETGRTELLESTAVGRYAGLTAALLVAGIGTAISAVLGTVGLISIGIGGSGAVAFGAAVAGAGAVFAGVAAVTAQLSTGARLARGLAFAVLAVAFLLRAVGDAGSGTLSWLSPIGWAQQVRPYADERWWVLLLPAITTVVLVAVAYRLLARRDLGAGLIAERPGPATSPPSLSGPVGLAWRSQRGLLIAWTVGLTVFALVMGGAAHGVSDQLGSSTAVTEALARLGGTQAIEDSFLALAFTIFGLLAGAYSISAVLQLHDEEESGRAESVLAASVGRRRWAMSHILFALVGPAVALAVAGLVAGFAYGTSIDDVGGQVPRILGAALVQLPGVWLLAGIAVAMFGLMPRFAPAAWGVFGAMMALYVFGMVADLPQPLLDLVPFLHLPRLPGGEFQAAPVVWLLAIAAALVVGGLAALRRRDVR
ncbi:ABC transporter permease [Prescottella agglutinans]|uniref:ABC transporter permease n=1 Tax=Prescottella agglutinans TaxID=1644129 RepID=A0A3S3E7Y1_9NOCA|nr:ABC transporter permease [Prescottella agglutinans]RVW07792.1 ABC transporter permease [Prescottella agglutinans]